MSGLASVNKVLGKIVNNTTAFVNGEIGNVKIPKVVLGDSLGIDIEEVSTIDGLLNSIHSSAENLMQITRQITCLSYLITDPAHVTGTLLGGLAGNIANIAATLTMQVINAFSTQISIALDQIIGTGISVLNNLSNLFKELQHLIDAIRTIPSKFKELSAKNLDFLMNRDKCEMMFAQIAACYLSKILQKAGIFDFVNKLTNKINQVGNDINNSISEELEDVNIMNNYLARENYLLNKASIQINNFHF